MRTLLPIFIILANCIQAGSVVDNTLINVSIGPTFTSSFDSQKNNGKVVEVRPGLNYRLGVGMRRASGFGLMLFSGYSYNKLERNTLEEIQNGHIHSYNLGLEGMYHLGARYHINPYISAGAGLRQVTNSVNTTAGVHKEESDTKPAIFLGGGIEYRIDKYIGIDTQFKHSITKFNFVQHSGTQKDDLKSSTLTIGLQYAV